MINHLAIIGATGAVGQEACIVLQQRDLPVNRLSLLASKQRAGTVVRMRGEEITVQEVSEEALKDVDYAILAVEASASEKLAPYLKEHGAVVIDNSSAFRMEPDVPLVVPEINPDDIARHQGIIANPNCSTILVNLAMWPLHRFNPLRRVVVSTYQAASGAGLGAMLELKEQLAACAAGTEVAPRVFPYPLACNLFIHESQVRPDGYNLEERKMINETRKIFHEPGLGITATCVRVPVMRAHSASLNLTFERPMEVEQVRDLLESAPGVDLIDDPEVGRFPMPVDATGRDHVLVGHIRQDFSQPDRRGIDLFVCGDQLRKGAALNVIQIIEHLIGRAA